MGNFSYYLHQRERFNTHRLNKVQEAACFMFLNRTCFNGLYRVNSKGMFNVPFGRYKNVALYDEKTLYEDSKLLQRVTILQGDFEATKVFANTNTLVYFDPPYRPLDATSNFTAYAKEPFGDEEQRRLKRYFDELHQRGCRLMLSNSDPTTRNANDDFFDALYRDYYIHRVYASRAINAKAEKCGKIAELFITNYPAVSHVTLKDNAYPSVSLKEKRYEPSPQQRTV